MRCFYSEELELKLPSGHPFPMEKFRVSKDMLLEGGILRPEEIVEVRSAHSHLLQRVHEPEYIRKIESGRLDRKEQILLGLPVTPGLFTRSATEVEATRLACHAALTEGIGVCLAGGTHHAFREHGEGYCVFNDVAIAIRDLQDKQPNIKIMVVDTDAHQGNGTAALLADDPRVFTYSIHVGRNYPTKKTTSTLDIETVRYVEGEMYLKQLFSTLAGARVSIGQLAACLAGALALSGLLLLGFAPAGGVFAESTDSFGFMGALGVGTWIIAVVFALRFLKSVVFATGGTQKGPVMIWSAVFLLVTLQMTTSLRPILGRSDIFLTQEKKFFLQHWGEAFGKSLKPQAGAAMPDPEGIPADPPATPSRGGRNPFNE